MNYFHIRYKIIYHVDPDDHPYLVFLEKPLKLTSNNLNPQDPYPWLDKEDPKERHGLYKLFYH